MDIGLLFEDMFLSPPLYMGITFAIFMLSEKVPLEKDLLHIKVNGSETYLKIYILSDDKALQNRFH